MEAITINANHPDLPSLISLDSPLLMFAKRFSQGRRVVFKTDMNGAIAVILKRVVASSKINVYFTSKRDLSVT